MALIATPAYAQDATGDESAPIIVTGSRIASQVTSSTAPLQVVDAQSIADSGATNIQELLLENPAFGTPGLSRTNSAFLTSGTGVATIDLRDLGSDRTLVLVNGRRVVASLDGSSTVDLNVIPTQFLERIDVLTGGASSLYGSDAMAGVVNFVYKRDFEGMIADGQIGTTERGDDIRYQANLTTGANFSDGRGNIMVHLGYSNEEGLLSRQRSNTELDDISSIYFGGEWGDSTAPYLSSYPEQGRFITSNGTYTYGPTGQLQSCFTTNGATCTGPLGAGTGPNGFNRQYYRTLAVPVERYTFAAVGHYEIADNVSAFFEGTYNKTSSSREIEPFPLSSDTSTGVYPFSGVMPIENYVTRDVNGDGTIDPVTERVIMVNPYVPAAIAAAATDQDGDGLRDIGFARRISEFGSRNGSTSRDFYRFVVGLEGDILNNFHWDLSYNFGQVTENQVSNGQVNVVNFRDALAGQLDVDDLDGDGLTTDVVCISAEARANGCVAANIFGKGSISQGAVDYIAAQSSFQTKIQQQVVDGNISGSIFDLPHGPLGLALGFEYRKEKSAADNDALTNQGLNAGNLLPDTFGDFDVIEGYAEVKVPILADMPFFQLLEVGGAYRIADYSTVGSVSSWNVQGTWEPVRDIRFRATYAKAVRAPNIGELYAGLSQTFPSGLQDPCEGIGATGGGDLGTNCRAAPGVLANINANGTFTLSQGDIQGISGFNGGNANLHEEEADSWTVGMVLTPRWLDALRNLTITVDYYNITINDVIAGFGRAFTLDQCYNSGNPTFCQLITRRPGATATNSSGSIEFINDFSVNAAKIATEGLDITASWYAPLDLFGAPGRLFASGSYTHLFKYHYFPLEGEDPDLQDGEIGTAGDRFTAKLGYSTDKFRTTFTGTFIGKSWEDDQFDGYHAYSVPAIFYLDMQSSFAPTDKFEFYFGVDNLLDTAAPNILSGTTFNVTGADTAADVYDVFGRRYYAGVRLRF